MPRRSLPEPDYAAVLATLPPAQRETVAQWEQALGLPRNGWVAIPGLRDLLVIIAGTTLAAEMPELSASDAFSEALEMLGVRDDSDDRNTRPSDSLGRKLRRWVTDAHCIQDIDVQPRFTGNREISRMTSRRN